MPEPSAASPSSQTSTTAVTQESSPSPVPKALVFERAITKIPQGPPNLIAIEGSGPRFQQVDPR